MMKSAYLWIEQRSSLDAQTRAHRIHIITSSLCALVIALQQLFVCFVLQELLPCNHVSTVTCWPQAAASP